MPVSSVQIPDQICFPSTPVTQHNNVNPVFSEQTPSIDPAQATIQPIEVPQINISSDIEALMSLENIPLFDDFLPAEQVKIPKHSSMSNESKPSNSLSWSDTIAKLNLTGLALAAAENATWLEYNSGKVTLGVSTSHQSLFTPATIKKLELGFETIYQEKIKLTLQTEDAIQATPAQNKRRLIDEDREKADKLLAADPFFQSLQQAFSAEIVKDSVELIKDSI